MTEAMIDIETLDVRPTAVVLSIGLVAFNEDGPLTQSDNAFQPQALFLPSLEDQLAKGRTVGISTLKFWAEQGKGPAVDESFQSEGRYDPETIILWIGQWLRRFEVTTLWANGDVFDLGIIQNLAQSHGFPDPWPKYNMPRDLRTLKAEAVSLGFDPLALDTTEAAHSALGDCRWQINQLLAIRKFLRTPLEAR